MGNVFAGSKSYQLDQRRLVALVDIRRQSDFFKDKGVNEASKTGSSFKVGWYDVGDCGWL